MARIHVNTGTLDRASLRSIHLQSAPAVQRRVTADLHPVADEVADHFSAAGRNLTGEKLRLPEALRPIRDQRAMGGARGGVFINARRGSEETRYKIAIHARRRGDDA